MNLLFEILRAVFAYFEAFVYFFKYQLFKYFFLLIFLAIIFAVPFSFLDLLFSIFFAKFPWVPAKQTFWMGLNWLATLSGFILLLILSPLFSLVSDEVSQKMTGQKKKFSLIRFLKELWRNILMGLRNMFWQIIGLTFLYFFILVTRESVWLNRLIYLTLGLMTAYFYGLTILDYALENKGLTYRSSLKFAAQHPGLILGLGLVYEIAINLNLILDVQSEQWALFWPFFAKSLVAFMGVLAASIIVFKEAIFKKN